MNRNEFARDAVNGALVMLTNPTGCNGYEYWFVQYLDNAQKAMVPASELRSVTVGPHHRR